MILLVRRVGDLVKKNSTLLILCTILLVISVIGISYAMVTTSLDIKGKMQMSSASWDVHFENLKDANIVGTAIEMDKPYITSKATSIMNIDVKLQQPTDSITYFFEVVNGGGLDAELSSYQIAEPACNGRGDNAIRDSEIVCKKIKYEIMYADGTKVNIGDTLKKDERKKLKLKLSYTGTQMPVNEVDISNLSIVLSYSQM